MGLKSKTRSLKKYPKSSTHCKAIENKIKSHQEELDKRWKEYELDIGKLPERIGPGEKLSQTRRGHRTLINQHDNQLRKWQKIYEEECVEDNDCNCKIV